MKFNHFYLTSFQIIVLSLSIFISTKAFSKDYSISDTYELIQALSNIENSEVDSRLIINEGVYQGTFTLMPQNDISITITSNNVDPTKVVFDANSLNTIFDIETEKRVNIFINGISFVNGFREGNTAGLRIYSKGGVKINKCIFHSNKSLNSYASALKIFSDSDVAVSESYFLTNSVENSTDNNSTIYGGSILIGSKKLTFDSNYIQTTSVIVKNQVDFSVLGGGIHIYKVSKLYLFNNVISNNYISNSCEAGDYAFDYNYSYGGGLYIESNNQEDFEAMILNNTISNNSTYAFSSHGDKAKSHGGGMYIKINESDFIQSVSIINNIIWGNRSNGGGPAPSVKGIDLFIEDLDSKNVILMNNNISDLFGTPKSTINPLNIDPSFVNSNDMNYHLMEESGCIDQGFSNLPIEILTDNDKNDRIINEIIDLGAYEFGPSQANSPPYTPINPTPENNSINIPLEAILQWEGGDPDLNDTVTYDIHFSRADFEVYHLHALLKANLKELSYDISDLLEYNTNYFWRIVAKDSFNNVVLGDVWKFTTQSVGKISLEVMTKITGQQTNLYGVNVTVLETGKNYYMGHPISGEDLITNLPYGVYNILITKKYFSPVLLKNISLHEQSISLDTIYMNCFVEDLNKESVAGLEEIIYLLQQLTIIN